MKHIRIIGASEHNLRHISCRIPRNALSVITGVSGSGKSSLAFDTIYAEGQRRYIESLSAYARQFLDRLPKPHVEFIEGLSPSISIEQKTISRNPRSTVGTVTEIYDYMRVLFATIGVPHDPKTGLPIRRQTTEEITEQILSTLSEGTKMLVLSPVVRGRKGDYGWLFDQLLKQGFVRARVDGKIINFSEGGLKLARQKTHTIEVVIDRLKASEKSKARLQTAVETAVEKSKGFVVVTLVEDEQKTTKTKKKGAVKDLNFSTQFASPDSDFSIGEIAPRLFSFNSPYGACKRCNGLGYTGGGFDDEENWDGDAVSFDEGNRCTACDGWRLNARALAVKVYGKHIAELARMGVSELRTFLDEMPLTDREFKIAEQLLGEITSRLDFMIEVGADYLTLDRPSITLAGGEAQRIRLAAQIGSRLTGVLYVLDEPSIGLHARDHYRLLGLLRKLRDQGNTIIVVEHDEETIRQADFVLDLGPGAGEKGGRIIATGTPDEIAANKKSLTGRYLCGAENIPMPGKRRKPEKWLTIEGAHHHNLKSIMAKFPLGCITCVTGVSGSGKSSLVIETLYRALAVRLYNSSAPPGSHKRIDGLKEIDKVIEVDQAPIGRTPRSNPATYTKLFDHIRNWFARMPEAQARGYTPGRFSFNVKGGRCEECTGAGMIKVEMSFLPNVYVECEACHGRRYNPETLEVLYNGRSIADVLEMRVSDALELFSAIPKVRDRLQTLVDVGLGYISLGQYATTLSGGEAQRIKLSRELGKRSTGQTLFILDEPTTGLHFDDVKKLLAVLQRLADEGNTVVVIEHNLDVIKCADWIIDLGPEGGAAGGEIVAAGPPEKIAKIERSHTGQFLSKILGRKVQTLNKRL